MSLTLFGPFTQLLPMHGLPLLGPLSDTTLPMIAEGGILCAGEKVQAIGVFADLRQAHPTAAVHHVSGPNVALPGFIDAHTHICFGGSRAMDYAARNAGTSYLDIAKAGGGIWSTVQHTRAAGPAGLLEGMRPRVQRLLAQGITTAEVKSGYGLSVQTELDMLRTIQIMDAESPLDLIATCLAAHMVPRDFTGDEWAYLDHILTELVPLIEAEGLAQRFDIFVEESAFSTEAALEYLHALKQRGHVLTVHGDQFSTGGSAVAVEVGAQSVDHLEVSTAAEIARLADSSVIPVALPGASLGLGCAFAPARQLLDAGCSLAIASDWNPGSAPMGALLTQAALLGSFEKLSTTEVLAGMTYRAAAALGLTDRGQLAPGTQGDFIAFPTADYREILYHQGSLQPHLVWKNAQALSLT